MKKQKHTPFKYEFLVGSSAVALVLLLGLLAVGTNAASVRYKFTARGTVTHVDLVNDSFKIDVSKATSTSKSANEKAFDDLEGKNKEFKIGSGAKFYKVVNGKDKRVTEANLAVGQEVGLKGEALDNDTYEITFGRIHDRAFTVVGLIKEHNKTARTIKVLFTTSTYKPATYKKGTEITMDYPEDATFYAKTTATPVVFSDVDADDQKIKVTGTIENSSTWKIKTLINNYKGN